jgi:hypothetical protein
MASGRGARKEKENISTWLARRQASNTTTKNNSNLAFQGNGGDNENVHRSNCTGSAWVTTGTPSNPDINIESEDGTAHVIRWHLLELLFLFKPEPNARDGSSAPLPAGRAGSVRRRVVVGAPEAVSVSDEVGRALLPRRAGKKRVPGVITRLSAAIPVCPLHLQEAPESHCQPARDVSTDRPSLAPRRSPVNDDGRRSAELVPRVLLVEGLSNPRPGGSGRAPRRFRGGCCRSTGRSRAGVGPKCCDRSGRHCTPGRALARGAPPTLDYDGHGDSVPVTG